MNCPETAMNGRPSLLLIGPTPPPFHGVAVAVQTLLHSSITQQFHVCHVDLADRRGIEHVNKPDAYDVVLFCRQWLSLCGALLRGMPELTYLVLSQSTIGFLRDSFLIWPACLCRSRIVLHLHGGHFRDWFLGRSKVMKAYVRFVLRRVTRIIVLGESLKNQFEGLVDEERISVVPNGVDWPAHGARAGRRGCSRYRILHVSTLSHLKGALILLEAVPLVVDRRQDVEFVLAGPWSHPDDKRWADDFVEQHGLAGYVSFSGPIQGAEKCALFASADVFVFPGIQQEGQPLVVIEAMAAGLPVIFTNRGCLRDTVQDGMTGVEVSISDSRGLADRICWVLEHPQEMDSMGQRARQRYETLYTKERHIANMAEVLLESCTEGALG